MILDKQQKRDYVLLYKISPPKLYIIKDYLNIYPAKKLI